MVDPCPTAVCVCVVVLDVTDLLLLSSSVLSGLCSSDCPEDVKVTRLSLLPLYK